MQLSFGGYSFDTATRQLLFGAGEVALSPKAVDLLQFLIDQRPRALSKTELHDRLWPATFVTDAALTVLVAELRDALHDQPHAPRFIRTVRRFGYAFCGEISSTLDQSSTPRTCWIIWNGCEIALHEGENIIGRDPEAAVRLDLPSVSRRHARIVVSSTGAVIEDLASKNGTVLRNDRVAGAMSLSDLDEVQVGSARLLIRILRGDVQTQTLGDR
jgi:DNA-binding winged helix-turn-helix (wHTH) protein